jgi:hypothetical protein
MGRRWGFAVVAWLAAAAVTTLIGLAAVNSIGDGILGGADRPFSAADVDTRLSAAPALPSLPPPSSSLPSSSLPSLPPPSLPPPSLSPSAVASAVSGVLATAGGTVVATCTAGQAYLSSWSPNQGYQADHIVRGPGTTASIRFRGDKGRGVRLSVTCPNNVPTGSNTDD